MKKTEWTAKDEFQLKSTINDWPQLKAPETLRQRLSLLMQAPKYRLWHLVIALAFMVLFPPVFSRLASVYAPNVNSSIMIWVYVAAGSIAFILMAMMVVQVMYELESGRREMPRFATHSLKRADGK